MSYTTKRNKEWVAENHAKHGLLYAAVWSIYGIAEKKKINLWCCVNEMKLQSPLPLRWVGAYK